MSDLSEDSVSDHHLSDQDDSETVESKGYHHLPSTPFSSFSSSEEIIQYLDKKYSNRFNMDDPMFMEALNTDQLPPPMLVNYTGRVFRQARRNFNNNNNNSRGGNFHNSRGGYSNNNQFNRYQGGNKRS